MQIKNIYLGYWYQRTGLHLSEMYDFLSGRPSPLSLDPQRLKNLLNDLNISTVKMEIGYMEFIEVLTEEGIKIRIDEDGLVVLSIKPSGDLMKDFLKINKYFRQKFLPAVDFIFSLGAPLPREILKNKTTAPYFIEIKSASEKEIDSLFARFKQSRYYEIIVQGIKLYRGGNVFVLMPENDFLNIRELVDMQVFFREFKAQLHSYLNLHRSIWEKIAKVKENREVRGGEISFLRNQLETYKRTVDLIDGRINQMGVYLETRESLVKRLGWEEFLVIMLQFKYNTLGNALDYIKAVWQMTKNYINSAIDVFNEIQSISTKDSIRALTIVTVVGVVATTFRFLVSYKEQLFTVSNFAYLLIIISLAWLVYYLVQIFYQKKKYRIKKI